MNKKSLISLVVIAVFVVGFTFVTSGSPAFFRYENLELSHKTIEAGSSVAATATVTNVTGEEGTAYTNFYVDGILAKTKEMTIAGGESKEVNFDMTLTKGGKHSISIGNTPEKFVYVPPEWVVGDFEPEEPGNVERYYTKPVPEDTEVNIDGKLDEWPENTLVTTLDSEEDYVVGGGGWTPEDISGDIYLMWDESALYFAARLLDDSHEQPRVDGKQWQGDGIQMTVDPLNEGVKNYKRPEESDVYELGFAMNNAGETGSWAWAAGPGLNRETGKVEHPLAVMRNDKTNVTIYEARIPAEVLAPMKFQVGHVYRSNTIINDIDAEESREVIGMTPEMVKRKTTTDSPQFVLAPSEVVEE